MAAATAAGIERDNNGQIDQIVADKIRKDVDQERLKHSGFCESFLLPQDLKITSSSQIYTILSPIQALIVGTRFCEAFSCS